MASTEKQKQSLYFPEDMLREIMREAIRLDRSLSWTVQQAWALARESVRRFPSSEPRAVPRPEARPARERSVDEIRASDQLREFLRGKFDRDAAP